MNGNQEMGGAGLGRSEAEAIPSSTSALAEVIYVGRASFRVALAVEAPAPAADTTSWFHSVEGEAHEPVVLTSGPSGMAASVCRSEPSDIDAVPILYDSEVVSAAPRRRRTSRWTIGLPLAFGGFFCGILMSPLVSPLHPEREIGFTAKVAPAPQVVLAAVPPAVVPPIVAPIVAPTLPLEPAVPAVTVVAENSPSRLAMGGTMGGMKAVMPVQGRAPASEKSGVRKLVPRRSPRIASSSPAVASTASTWVDPWADNN